MSKTLIKILAIVTICCLVVSVILVFIAFDSGDISSVGHNIFNIIHNTVNFYVLNLLYKEAI
jgi:hypothetical protein